MEKSNIGASHDRRIKPYGGRLSKIQEIESFKLSQFNTLRYQTEDTLRLQKNKRFYRETDSKFVTDIQAIAQINQNIFQILENNPDKPTLTDQQCDEAHHKAIIHRQANIINNNSKLKFQETDTAYQCKCGCKRAKGYKIPICCETEELQVLGSGVVLFMLFQKGIVANMLIAVLLFGVFATLANLSAGDLPSKIDNCLDSKCIFLNNSSAKNNQYDSSKIEYLLGMLLCLIWIFTLRYIRHYGRKQDKLLDAHLTSASDFAVKVSNLPFGEYCEYDLIEYFTKLSQKQQSYEAEQAGKQRWSNSIKSIQIVYNMQFCRKLIQRIINNCSNASDLLITNSGHFTIKSQDYDLYYKLRNQIIQNYQLLHDLRKKFLNDTQFRKKLSTASCLIEFQNQEAKIQMLKKYGKQKIGLLKQIQAKFYKIFCPSASNILFRGKILVLQRAPQPSDLIWLNCQKKSSTLRMLLIYCITLLIIFISFGLLLGLQFLNYYMLVQNNNIANTQTQIIGLITTIALQVVNKILWLVLYFLLDIEYNDTMTNKIISLMNKALFATCVNILILPMIVYIYIKDDIYGAVGLTGFIFDYHITVVTVGLALKFLNPVDLIKRLLFTIRPIRNKILRFFRNNYDTNDQRTFLAKINQMYEGEYLDVAEAYIFVITNIFHATFFCHLSPPILFFAFIQVFLFYWINKTKLLRFFKIPQLTQILVFDTALSQAGLVPIIYGLGSLFLTYVQNDMNYEYGFSLIYQMIAIFIGVISFLNPCDMFNIMIDKIYQLLNLLDRKVQDSCQSQLTNIQLIKAIGDANLNQETMAKPEEKVVRLQDYYCSSNSLKLLGFQQVLKGKDSNIVSKELKSYCQSFFKDEEDINQVMQEIKKKTIAYIQDGQAYSQVSDCHPTSINNGVS